MTQRILMFLENNAYPHDPRVRNEAGTLRDAGYQVMVICPRERSMAAYENYEGVYVYRFPAPPDGSGLVGYLWEYGYSTLAILITSLWVLMRRGFDAIHLHNPPDILVFIALIYKLFGKRVVFDHHDLAPEMYKVLFRSPKKVIHRILLLMENLSCRVADHVIVTNQSYKELDIARNGVSAENISIVRNGPNVKFKPVPPDPTLKMEGKKTLCYVGDMGHHDGLDYLLRSLNHLRNDMNRTDFHCLMVGGGNAWEEMRELASELELDDYVDFTGYVMFTDVTRYLSSCDICIAPEPSNEYNDRSTVIKMMEYMAIGKPIVSFDLPEHRFSAQGAAIYAKPNDELDFARKIAYLMDNPEIREEMANVGRSRIQHELSWPHQAQELLSAYESVFSKARNSAPEKETLKV